MVTSRPNKENSFQKKEMNTVLQIVRSDEVWELATGFTTQRSSSNENDYIGRVGRGRETRN